MIKANAHYFDLSPNYLFQDIARRVRDFKAENPGEEVISLGVGDVTQPIPAAAVKAMHKAADEMLDAKTMRGYGPEQGYPFLLEAIVENDYKPLGVDIRPEEVFVSDGAKCDVGNVQEIFDASVSVAVPDPVYPVYRDTNIMAGRKVSFLPSTAETGFSPALPDKAFDLIYLCSPNNPTGAVMTRDQLAQWVDYARRNNAVIIFDSAYKAYIRTPGVPESIYEIPGAKECAIELRSFSKTAGFTGVRCAYMVIPEALKALSPSGEKVPLNRLWSRRHTTKFNGVAYIVQRAAEAVFSDEGKEQVKAMTDYYMENARLIREGLADKGFTAYGGVDAPYIWLATPEGMTSVALFEKFLTEGRIICTPGSGFGACGEGYVRLTSFNTRENTLKALDRIGALKL